MPVAESPSRCANKVTISLDSNRLSCLKSKNQATLDGRNPAPLWKTMGNHCWLAFNHPHHLWKTDDVLGFLRAFTLRVRSWHQLALPRLAALIRMFGSASLGVATMSGFSSPPAGICAFVTGNGEAASGPGTPKKLRARGASSKTKRCGLEGS